MSSEVYNIVKAKITTTDIQAFKTQANKMKEASREEVGTIIYDFFINENKKEVLIIEKYADGNAFMTHMKKFLQPAYIPKLLEMQEITSIEMPGLVTKEMKALFMEGGWSYNGYPLDI